MSAVSIDGTASRSSDVLKMAAVQACEVFVECDSRCIRFKAGVVVGCSRNRLVLSDGLPGRHVDTIIVVSIVSHASRVLTTLFEA